MLPVMPRTARASQGGIIYHVLNRGNAGMRLFHKTGDFDSFVKLLAQAQEFVTVRILGYCLMPTHWHLVLWPRRDGDLSAFIGWLANTHVRRYHQHYGSYGKGHLYQGRFKSFPVKDDHHFLTLMRYVEANPLRANLVDRAHDWQWSSLAARRRPNIRIILSDWPVPRPTHWTRLVNQPQDEAALDRVRTSVARGRPLGNDAWVRRVAKRLSLEFTLRPRGRPRLRTST